MDVKINVNTTLSPCLLHGPCGTVCHDGKTACVRCVKRELRPRATKRDLGTKKDEVSLQVDLHGIKLKQVKDVQRTYLQVVVVPAVINKTLETTIKERQKRLKYQDEMADIEGRREIRIRKMCMAYCLPIPTLYSPFVHNPFWFRQKRDDCSDHLHLVQAVLQSFEKREKVHNIGELKSLDESTLYRTSKIAAWRALHVRDGDNHSLSIDLLPEQQAAKSYMAFLSKVDHLTGGMPTATGPKGYQPCSKFLTRVSGPRRRNPMNTYKSNKYMLKSYRYRGKKRHSVAHQVKATAKMTKWLGVANKSKDGDILKRLRTAIILRKSYCRNSVEFKQSLKLFLLDHASDMIGPNTPYRWLKYFQTAIPPPKQASQIGMASYILEHRRLRELLKAWVKQEREKERARSAKIGQSEKVKKMSIHEQGHIASRRCPRCKGLKTQTTKNAKEKPTTENSNKASVPKSKKANTENSKLEKPKKHKSHMELENESEEDKSEKEDKGDISVTSASSSVSLISSEEDTDGGEEEEEEEEEEGDETQNEQTTTENETYCELTEDDKGKPKIQSDVTPDSDLPDIIVETPPVLDEKQHQAPSLPASPALLEPACTPSPDPGSDEDGRRSRGCSKSCCSLL